MLAYAAHRRLPGAASSPKSLALIVAAHAAALALLITAKTDIPRKIFPPTEIDWIESEKPPPPPDPRPVPEPRQQPRSQLDNPKPVIGTDVVRTVEVAAVDEAPTSTGPFAGTATIELPPSDPPVPPAVTRTAARFATPDDLVKPPYPPSKQRLEEEASLRLSLSIDPRGRVVAVDPVGATDPEFLAAARKHILRYWRYKPALENGTAVASRTELTLKFELDE